MNCHLPTKNSGQLRRDVVPPGLVGLPRSLGKDDSGSSRNGGAFVGLSLLLLLPLALLADHDVAALGHVLHQLQEDVSCLDQVPEIAWLKVGDSS